MSDWIFFFFFVVDSFENVSHRSSSNLFIGTFSTMDNLRPPGGYSTVVFTTLHDNVELIQSIISVQMVFLVGAMGLTLVELAH